MISVLVRSKSDCFAFINALITQHEDHHVAPLCRRYHVTPGGFYAWRRRQDSAHAKQDRELTAKIVRLFAGHQERYGSPRLHREMVQTGWSASRHRVARLMRAAGLRAKAVRGYRAKAGFARDSRSTATVRALTTTIGNAAPANARCSPPRQQRAGAPIGICANSAEDLDTRQRYRSSLCDASVFQVHPSRRHGMRFVRFAGLTVSLALLGCKPTPNDIYNALPSIGSPVPAFRYVALDGSILTPASLLGKPAVIALWSTTCSASRLALASIAALNAEYAAPGVSVVILADDHDAAAVAATIAHARQPVRVALAANSLMDTFTHGQSLLPWRKAFALPTFLVLETGGKVVYRQIGIEQDASQRLARLRGHVDSLLSRPTL